MGRYKKKMFEVTAVQITSQTFDAPHPNPEHIPGVVYDHTLRCAYVQTPIGRMRADLGDWIVCGPKGDLFVDRPDVFETNYEAVSETAANQTPTLATLRQAIIDNTRGDLFWVGEFLLADLEKETGFKG